MAEKLIGLYCKDQNITVVFKQVYGTDEKLVSEEIVGWYYGEPNPFSINLYSTGKPDSLLVKY